MSMQRGAAVHNRLHGLAISLALSSACVADMGQPTGMSDSGPATMSMAVGKVDRQDAPAANSQRAPGPVADGPASDAGVTVAIDAVATVPRSPAAAVVSITEVMYHPVLEESAEDNHEFIELHNRSTAAVSLRGWRLAGGAAYTFPVGATIAAGQYLVVAKNRAKLAAVTAYGLDAAALHGDYTGSLDNGGDRITLLDASGAAVDSVAYDDRFPWPVAGDALGAGESWLRPELLPLRKHQYMGVSLERVSLDAPSAELANWAPSPVDGATPGRANRSAGPLRPVVARLAFGPDNETGTAIAAADRVAIAVEFSGGTPRSPAVEYFVDVIDRTDELMAKAPLAAAGPGFRALLPPQVDNSIVRFRIVGDTGTGPGIISPRPSDPAPWHAYFVAPSLATKSRLYHLFIAPADWAKLWDNIAPGKGRVLGCAINGQWDARVPAVFVFEGRVYDVLARHQGSRYNRMNGINFVRPFAGRGPAGGPTPLRALSWNIKFPRYARFEGRATLNLNKMKDSCPGFSAALGGHLMTTAGIAAPQIRFARFHINGGYYHYMMHVEQPDEDMLERHHGKKELVGDLFKSTGCVCDEGPYGWGDARLLRPLCNYTAAQRYAATYERKTFDWKTEHPVMAFIEEMHQARAAGLPAMRAFVEKKFDVNLMLSGLAIRNWGIPWDDQTHNYFLYLKPDGRWLVNPWDFDFDFSGIHPATRSFFIGEACDKDNRWGLWNSIKDTVLRSHREEYRARLVELDKGLLDPATIGKVLDEVAATFDTAEARMAPAGLACDPAAQVIKMKRFAEARRATLRDAAAPAWTPPPACTPPM